jgi:hypothetical protein
MKRDLRRYQNSPSYRIHLNLVFGWRWLDLFILWAGCSWDGIDLPVDGNGPGSPCMACADVTGLGGKKAG